MPCTQDRVSVWRRLTDSPLSCDLWVHGGKEQAGSYCRAVVRSRFGVFFQISPLAAEHKARANFADAQECNSWASQGLLSYAY